MRVVMPQTLPKSTASGIAAVSGYDPWSKRTLDSIKDSLADDIPIFIRLHSAADYPCETVEDTKRLDMESHAVLIVGYDDESEEFLAIDPWNEGWRGEFGGVIQLPYSILHKVCVNCSADKCTRMSEMYTDVTITSNDKQNLVNLNIGFYTPRGYIMDKEDTQFTSFEVTLKSERNSFEVTRKVLGTWEIGEYAKLCFPIPINKSGIDTLSFDVKATIEGLRPYKYTDTFNYFFIEDVEYLAVERSISKSASSRNII